MAPDAQLVASLITPIEDMVPLCVETGTDHFRIPSDGEVNYIVEYAGSRPTHVAACGSRGLFVRTQTEEFFWSPLATAGTTAL